MVYMIFVERTGQAGQYADFDKNLRALGNWAELGQGGLLLEADRLTAAQIRDLLRPHLPDGDKMFVARISKNWAGMRMPASFPDWMGRRNFDAKGTLPRPRSASPALPAPRALIALALACEGELAFPWPRLLRCADGQGRTRQG